MAFPKVLITYLLLVLVSNNFSEAATLIAEIFWDATSVQTKSAAEKLRLDIGDSLGSLLIFHSLIYFMVFHFYPLELLIFVLF